LNIESDEKFSRRQFILRAKGKIEVFNNSVYRPYCPLPLSTATFFISADCTLQSARCFDKRMTYWLILNY